MFTPGRVDAKVKFAARGQAIAQTLPCLSLDSPAMTGTYDLDADLTASGTPDDLRDSARGTFRLTARDGRIVHSDVLERTLTVDEIAKRMQSDAPKLQANGVDYKQITLAGSIEAGRAHLDQGVIDGASMYLTIRGDVKFADGGLELNGLVAPNAGRPFGAALVVVPVGIRGTVSDPQVNVVPAAAVGMTLINLITARFLLPFSLFDIAGGGSQGKP